MLKVELLPIDKIRIDGNTQTRAAMRDDIVKEYREAVLMGLDLPPIVVYVDAEDQCWLADGFHRLEAHKGFAEEIACEIHEGTVRDALLHSAGANEVHGLRRSPADKRQAITMVLADSEWCEASDRWVAEKCHVSHTLVADVRRHIEGQKVSQDVSTGAASSSNNQGEENSQEGDQAEPTRIGRDGKRRPAKKPRKPKEESEAPTILCQRCKISGIPARDCPECKEAREAAGGGGGSKAGAGADRPKKAGEELFSWNNFETQFGPVVRAPDALAAAYKDKGTEHAQCLEHLEAFMKTFKGWYKRLTKAG